MTTRAQLEALVERVRQAMGPDRKIDAAVYRAIFDDGGWVGENWYIDRSDNGSMGSSRVISLPGYTASLDAVVALIERELPERHLDLHWPRMGRLPEAVLSESHASRAVTVGTGATMPLALLAAFLAVKLSSLPEEA